MEENESYVLPFFLLSPLLPSSLHFLHPLLPLLSLPLSSPFLYYYLITPPPPFHFQILSVTVKCFHVEVADYLASQLTIIGEDEGRSSQIVSQVSEDDVDGVDEGYGDRERNNGGGGRNILHTLIEWYLSFPLVTTPFSLVLDRSLS